MAYRVISNKKYGEVQLLVTSNSTVIVAGNSSVSNVATSDEVLSGASISKIWFGSPSGNAAYWDIRRGSNLVFVADTSGYIDFAGHGGSITIDPSANLVCNLVGTAVGTLIITLKKIANTNGFPTL